MYNTEDIKQQLIVKYKAGDFRVTKTGVKTVELQNVQFECDKDYIIREPNYDYASREIEWYESQSLNVNDISDAVSTLTLLNLACISLIKASNSATTDGIVV